MADQIPAQLEEAGKKLTEVVQKLGTNYLKGIVAEAFKPALEDGIKEALEDAKEEAGLGAPEEGIDSKLLYNKDEKERDTFIVNVDDSEIVTPGLGEKFVAYDAYVVRIGHTGDEKEKKFYVNAQYFKIRYGQLAKVPGKIAKDCKGKNLPAFPAPYEMGGTCCFCIDRKAGDKKQHDEAMHAYFENIFKELPYSPSTASHFRVGDDWEIQQLTKQIFMQAVTDTSGEFDMEFDYDIAPFDETEAVTELCKAIAIKGILPGIIDPLEASSDLPPIVKNRMLSTARNGVATAVETAAKGWEPLGAAAGAAGEKVTKMLTEAAEKIVDALKPLIQRVVGLIQEKMKKKAEEGGGDEGKESDEEKDEKKSAQIGDYVAEWKFEKTPIGKKLYDSLTGTTAVEAIKASSEEIESTLRAAVKEPVEKVVELICSAKYAVDYWTRRQIWWLGRRIVNLIMEVTTLEGFLEAAAKLAEAITPLEEEYCKAAGNKDELDKLADKASSVLWQSLADQAVGLWTRIYKLNSKVESVFSEQPEEVYTPLVELLSHIFEVQVRGFNAIRCLYARKLKETLSTAKDGDEVKQASRTALRDSIFEVVNLLAHEHWTKLHEALTEAGKAYVQTRFDADVWPDVKGGLETLASLLPEQVSSAGLDIEATGGKIATIVIDKGVTIAMKKIGLKLEKAIFAQPEGEGDSGEGYGS